MTSIRTIACTIMLQPSTAWTDEAFRTALFNEVRRQRHPHPVEILDNGKHEMRDILVLTVLAEIADDDEPAEVSRQLQESLDAVGRDGSRIGFVAGPGRNVYPMPLSDAFVTEFQDREDNYGFLGKDWIFPS